MSKKDWHKILNDLCVLRNVEMCELPRKIVSTTRLYYKCINHNSDILSQEAASFAWPLKDNTNCPGCKECAREAAMNALCVTEEEFTSRAMASGRYVEGTRFARSNIVPKKGDKSKWLMYCPACAGDEYSLAGVCNGEFLAAPTHLLKGTSPCRCNGLTTWSKKQIIYKIRKICDKSNSEFVCFNSEYTNGSTKITLCCKEHGIYDSNVFSFRFGHGSCPSCKKIGFKEHKQSVFYIVKVEGAHCFTGFGISNSIAGRLRTHKHFISKSDCWISAAHKFEMLGTHAKLLESALKERTDILPNYVEGFKTESLHSDELLPLIDFVYQYCYEKDIEFKESVQYFTTDQ